MKRRTPSGRVFCFDPLLLAASLLWPALTHGGLIVVPPDLASTEGNGSVVTPLNRTAETLQIAYDATLLTAIPVGSQITSMAFRLDGSHFQGPPTGGITFENYAIQFSRSLNEPGSLSTTFASNMDTDAVTVRDGLLHFDAFSFPNTTTPNEFGPAIPFVSPYTYQGGDLLITIRLTGQTLSGTWNSSDMDSQSAAGDYLGKVEMIRASTELATIATFTDNPAPVLQLAYTAVPVPELSTHGTTAGLLLLSFAAWRSRQAAPRPGVG